MTRARLAILCFLLVLLGGCLLHFARGYSRWDRHGHAWGCDDAFITYRYARNLAHGHGLVFNEGERVEGYSSILHLVLVAPSFLVTDGMGVYYAAFALNLVLVVLSFLLFVVHVRRRAGPDAAVMAAALFALNPVTWVWVASGLETILVLLLQLVAWATLDRIEEGDVGGSSWLLPASLVLSLFARPEGVMVTFVAAFLLLARGRRRQALWSVLAVVLAAAPYLMWRYGYYGGLLPNTYYAKVSGPLTARVLGGARQLEAVALQQGLLPHLLVLAFAAVTVLARDGARLRARAGGIPFEVALAACLLTFWIYVGGDHLGERFLLVLLCSLQMAPLAADGRFDYEREKYDLWVTLGDFLRENGSGITLAVDGAGKAPFLSGLRTIDMLGLNDRHLAHREVDFFNPGHNKYDADYVLSRKPDLIAAWVRTGDLDLAWGLERDKYREAGYALKYLVSVEKDLGPANIVDVSSMAIESIDGLLDRGFYYGILQKGPR